MGFDQYDSLREELLILNARSFFCLLLFFIGIILHNKYKSTAHSLLTNAIAKL